jgi:hydrogenase expression/formation protein HypC
MCLAAPGKIVSLNGEEAWARSGRVSFGGVVLDVNLACVPEAALGDYVLVHAGIAIGRVDEAEAGRVFEYLRQIEALEEPQSN